VQNGWPALDQAVTGLGSHRKGQRFTPLLNCYKISSQLVPEKLKNSMTQCIGGQTEEKSVTIKIRNYKTT